MQQTSATFAQRDALEALHPLPRAIARELATVPVGGMWIDDIVRAWLRAGERDDLIRLAISTLVDADFAFSPIPGRLTLRGWVRDLLSPRNRVPVSDLAFLVRHPRFRRLAVDNGVTTVAWQTRTVGVATLQGKLDDAVRMVALELRLYDALLAEVA